MSNIEPVSASIPYMVTAGNHEFKESSNVYYNNWFLGQANIGASSNSTDKVMWYSYDIGDKLHIVAVS